jgi:hypothetical protein
MQHSTPDREPARARLIGEIDGGPFEHRPQKRLYRCDNCAGVFWLTPPDFSRSGELLVVGMAPSDSFDRMREHNDDLVNAFDRNPKCECDFRNG